MALRLPSSIERFSQLREVNSSVWMEKGLPDHASVRVRVRWPLYFVPLVVINQLLTPHPVWIVLFIALVGLYGSAIFWVRQLAHGVTLDHRRIGEQLLVGDTFEEEFEVNNKTFVPVLWAEMSDHSRFPEAKPGPVVACGGNNYYRWRRTVSCKQRGVYRLGPYGLTMGDPFGLLELHLFVPKEEVIVIYPRVVAMPHRKFPFGQSTGADRRRRSILGATPAYSVLEYQPGDSLRRIHWRVTAHRGRLMVRELETEPTGDIWIVLDLNETVHRGEGPLGTLEFSITAAASLAATLLAGNEGRAVGLLAHSGIPEENMMPALEEGPFGDSIPIEEGGAVTVRPKAGPGQLWQILTALAPVVAGGVPLAQVLSGSRELFGPNSTLVVITPQVGQDSETIDSALDSGKLDTVSKGSDARTVAHEADRVDGDGHSGDGHTGDGYGGEEDDGSEDSGSVSRRRLGFWGNGHVEEAMAAVRSIEWPAELLHLRSGGFDGYAILITPNSEMESVAKDEADASSQPATEASRERAAQAESETVLAAAGRLQELLLAQRVQTDVLQASDDYAPVVTYRRRRTVMRSTPSGGVSAVDIDEEVG